MTAELHFAVSQFLYQKSELCDRYDWDAYLELYDEDSEYHIPQWIDDHRYVEDPNQGLSYIYYADRSGWRSRIPYPYRKSGLSDTFTTHPAQYSKCTG